MATHTVWVNADCSRSSTTTNTAANASVFGTTTANTIVFAGDNAYDNGSLAEYNGDFTTAYGAAKIARSYAIPGNHEYHTSDAGGFRSFWSGTGLMPTLPRGGFAHQRGNCAPPATINGWTLIFLDTAGDSSGAYFVDAQTNAWTAGYIADLDTWLASATDKAVIVFGHHMRYNPAGTGGHGNMSGVNPAWARMWNTDGTCKIAAWVGGHDHYLMGTKLINQAGTVVTDETKGCRMLCAGAGAASFDVVDTAAPKFDYGSSGLYGYLKLTIPDAVSGTPQPLTAQFYTTGNNGQGADTLAKTYTLDPSTTAVEPPPSTSGTLSIFGWGGGTGPDGEPLQSVSNDYKWNFARMARDVGGNGACMRADLVTPYSQSTDKWTPWSFADYDALVAIAAVNNAQIMFTVHAKSPGSTNQVPKVVNGVMQTWKAQWPILLDRYAGTNATIKAGSVVPVKWNDGTTTNLTIPSNWPGVQYWEVWNEPNQIGSCGGALAQGGTNQTLPWYQLVYIMNRDALNAAKAHRAWGQFKLSAITMGGLEVDYLVAFNGTTTTTNGVLQYGQSQGFDWGQFNSVSMHCYVKTDPMVATGSAGGRGVLDTIRTHIRPQMNSHGATNCKIWITEGGTGGSLSPNGGLERWNKYHPTASDATGTNTLTHGKGLTDVFWGHMFGESGANSAQTSGQLSQPFIMRNYIRKLRQMNTQNNAGVELCCPHMFIRNVPLVFKEADTNDYLYWQHARCFAELLSAMTNRNQYVDATGTPKRSSSWLPVASAYYDERVGVAANVAPTVGINSPATGTSTTATAITLSATATDDDGIASVEYRQKVGSGSFGAWTGMARTGTTSTYTASVAITRSSAGTANTIEVRATDSNAIPLTSGSQTTVITGINAADTTPPTLTVTAPAASATVANGTSTQAVTGSTSDSSGIASLTVNGTVQTLVSGAFSTSVNLTVGANPITVVSTDNAGLQTTITRTITRAAAADTTPPTLNIVTPSADGNVTNATTSIQLTGNADDNESDVVSVTINGTAAPSFGPFGGAWIWSTQGSDPPLAVGSNAFTVVATNAAGLKTTKVRTITRDPDTSGPEMVLSKPNSTYNVVNSVTVFAQDAQVTDANGVQKVTWAVNGGSQVIMGQDGGIDHWFDYSIGPLNVGANQIVYRAFDNSTAHNVTTFTQTVNRDSVPPPPDTTPPVLTVTTPAASGEVNYADTPHTVAGAVSDNVGVTTFTVNGVATAHPANAYSTTVALALGANVITVIAKDAAGNQTSISRTITRLANQPPTLTVTTPAADGVVADNVLTQTVAGAASDPISLTSVTVNGTAVTVGGGTYTTDIPLVTGPNTITVIATNSNGLTTTVIRTITRSEGADVTPPELVISTPPSDGSVLFPVTSVLVEGQATDDVAIDYVTVNGIAQVLDGSDNFSTTVDLEVGPNQIDILAADTSGLTVTETFTITRFPAVDSTDPVLDVDTPASNITVSGEDGTVYLVTGTVSDDTGVVQLYINGDLVPDVTAGAFSVQILLSEGPNPVVVLARDTANNSTTIDRTVTLVTVPPPVDTVSFSTDQLRIGLRIVQRGMAG